MLYYTTTEIIVTRAIIIRIYKLDNMSKRSLDGGYTAKVWQ
jgi:hypothetical protein